MAYFSNGSEGEQFREENCDRCVHDLKQGCAIWLLHLTRNYEQLKETPDGKAVKEMLNTLIPQDKDGFARKCSLFHSFTEAEEKEHDTQQNRLAGIDKPAPWIEDFLKKKERVSQL